MFLAIPDQRLKPTDKPIISFQERASGAPEAVRAWFYPGQTYGHEFVYPKVKATELAEENHMPVASMPDEMAANTTQPAQSKREPAVVAMEHAPVTAVQATGEEVEVAEVFLLVPAEGALPKSGSSLTLVGLIGLLSLATGVLLRHVSRA